MDLSKIYGLGFKIAEVSEGEASGLSSSVLVGIGIKNKYDGVYELTLRLDGWEAYGIASGVAGIYPNDIEIVTAGADAVSINYTTAGNPLQPGFTGGVGFITAATAFGATTPKYIFDLTTDKVISVVNTTPPDSRNRVLLLDPATTTSGYNPATKTIYIEYIMQQIGRPDQKIKTTYKYLRVR